MFAGAAQRQGRSHHRQGSEPHRSAAAEDMGEPLPVTPQLDLAGPGAVQGTHGLEGPRTMLSIINSNSPGSLANQRAAEGACPRSHPLPNPVGRLPAVTRSLPVHSVSNESPSTFHDNNSRSSAQGGRSTSVHSGRDAGLATSFGGHAGLGFGTPVTAGNTTGIMPCCSLHVCVACSGLE